MKTAHFVLIAALITALSACSHATDNGESGSGNYVEHASPVLYQTVVKKGGASVSFLLGASWGNSCGSFSRAEVTFDNSDVSVKVIGRQPKGAVCLDVMSSFTAPVTVALPKPGAYRFLFWQSDTSAIDTMFVIK
jgi:hypothetical protein